MGSSRARARSRRCSLPATNISPGGSVIAAEDPAAPPETPANPADVAAPVQLGLLNTSYVTEPVALEPPHLDRGRVGHGRALRDGDRCAALASTGQAGREDRVDREVCDLVSVFIGVGKPALPVACDGQAGRAFESAFGERDLPFAVEARAAVRGFRYVQRDAPAAGHRPDGVEVTRFGVLVEPAGGTVLSDVARGGRRFERLGGFVVLADLINRGLDSPDGKSVDSMNRPDGPLASRGP